MLTSAMLRHGLRSVNGKTQGSSHRREKACSPNCSGTSNKVTKTANIGQNLRHVTPAFAGILSAAASPSNDPLNRSVQIQD
jgi:hypothetical protein